MWVVNC